jgi:DNA-binding GntR family transcriptional regulator
LTFHLSLKLSGNSLTAPQSLHEQVYQVLRTAIFSGELRGGERLIETQLATKLQVSRTPIREAIRQLQREDLVVADGNGSLRVAKLSLEDAINLYDCRIALEQLAVIQACGNAKSRNIKKLEEAIGRVEKAMEQESKELSNFQLLHIDYQFHRQLAECSGNPWLENLLLQIFDKITLLRIPNIQDHPEIQEIRSEHRRIYDAIINRNEEAAKMAVQQHLMATKERVVREIRLLK